jgi:ABC-type cobalamin/Fe3+-siderophores transport system ATPase subunit
VDLSIDQGELVALAGPPGSGKTTLLHLMATLDRPGSGIVRLNGHLCQTNRAERSPDLWPGEGRGRRAPPRAARPGSPRWWPPGGPPGRPAPNAARPQHKARAATIIGRKVQHMEEGYTQLGTVLTDQRPEDSEADGVIVVGRFKGDPYDGVQLSYDAGRRNLYLTSEAALRLAILLAAAAERDIDIR